MRFDTGVSKVSAALLTGLSILFLIGTGCERTIQQTSVQGISVTPTTNTQTEQKPVSEPTFNEVARAGCETKNTYINKEVHWKARISDYAHTAGIRFQVIDDEHPLVAYATHGLFWGTFLAGAWPDPRNTHDGERNWRNRWDASWINYILEVYGHVDERKRNEDSVFLVTATVDYVDCDSDYDGGYIETTTKKVELLK